MAAVVAVVAALVALVPLPYVVLRPSGAIPVVPRVELSVPEDPVTGQLRLTTVRFVQVSAIGVLLGWLDDDTEVLRRDEVYPEGVDRQDYLDVQERLFVESTEVAAAVGLDAAGYEVELSGDGVEITAVLPGSAADGRLEVGDVVTAVDGEAVQLASELVTALGGVEAGDEVILTVVRDGREREVAVELAPLEDLGRPGLGVGVATVAPVIDLPVGVEVDRGGIVGPSAGLMLALAVYDLADEGDLTAGRDIAGTGTIDLSGNVGLVGGVAQKVAAARQAGVEVFLVPAAEADDARAAAGDALEVVPVSTMADALTALEAA